MRALLVVLLSAALAAGGFLLGHRVGRRAPEAGGVARRVRPAALEACWRAWFEGRDAALRAGAAALATAGLAGADADEARLLAALAAADLTALQALAEESAPVPAVRAGARRELARRAGDPAERLAHAARLRAAFPSSWTLRARGAFEPR